MNETTANQRAKKPGKALIWLGIIVALIGPLIDWFMWWTGGKSSATWIFLIAGAVIVLIGYLRRIALGVENKSTSTD